VKDALTVMIVISVLTVLTVAGDLIVTTAILVNTVNDARTALIALCLKNVKIATTAIGA